MGAFPAEISEMWINPFQLTHFVTRAPAFRARSISPHSPKRSLLGRQLQKKKSFLSIAWQASKTPPRCMAAAGRRRARLEKTDESG
jgi:hypothetical protein